MMIEFHSGSILERRWYITRVSQWCSMLADMEAPSSATYSAVDLASIILSNCW